MKTSNILTWLAGIVASLGTITGGLNWYINYRIDEYMKNRKGGFRSELSKEIGIPEEKISHAFGEMYRNLNGAVEDIDKFRHDYLPMLEAEKNIIDVGIKISKDNGDVSYISTDGKTYIPIYDANTKKYYVIFRDGHSEWCY